MSGGLKRAPAAVLLALAWPASAHETFLAPAGTAIAGAPLVLQLSSTARFPRAETAILPGRITRLSAVIGATPQPITVGKPAATWLGLETVPGVAGMLRIAVDLGPKPIALSPTKVDEYFTEVEASAAVRAAYAALPPPRAWNEFYTKHAKAIICVAPCTDAAAAIMPAGQALEFVAADAGLARFVLLAKGKPFAGQPVEIVDAKGRVTRARSDADGAVVVPGSVERPLLLATTVLVVPAGPGGAFNSDFATLWVGAR